MAREPQERDIGGMTFEITPLPARKGRRAVVRLFNRMAPAVADLLKGQEIGAEEDVDLLDMDLDWQSALRRIGEELTEDDIDYFCDLFAEHCKVAVDPEEPPVRLTQQFDDAFAQRYEAMLSWLWACMEINFKGFFSEQGASVAGALAAIRDKQQA